MQNIHVFQKSVALSVLKFSMANHIVKRQIWQGYRLLKKLDYVLKFERIMYIFSISPSIFDLFDSFIQSFMTSGYINFR